MTATDTHLKNQAAAIHNLKVQIGQISNMLASRPQGSLSRNTETNPKKQVYVITFRSGRVLKQSQDIKAEVEDNKDTGKVEKKGQKKFDQICEKNSAEQLEIWLI